MEAPLYLIFQPMNTIALVFRRFSIDAKLESGDVQMNGALRSSSPDGREGRRKTRVWEIVHSLLTGGAARPAALPSRVPVVALVVNEQDRHVLTNAFGEEPLDVRFAESCEEACSVANQLTAPVILLDRDWPETEWRAAVERLTASPHHACVILMSGVSDTYLWQELTRRGGYDVIPKPLQADKVERAVKLALSYWNSAPKPAERAGGLKK